MVLKSGKGFPYTLTSVILRTSKNSGEAERQIPDNSDEYKILTIIPPCMQLKIMFLLVPIDLFFFNKAQTFNELHSTAICASATTNRL